MPPKFWTCFTIFVRIFSKNNCSQTWTTSQSLYFYEHLGKSANMWLIRQKNTSCSKPSVRQCLFADVIQVQTKVFTFKCCFSIIQLFFLRAIKFWSSDKLKQNLITWSSMTVGVCMSAFIWSSQWCFTLILCI